MTLLASNKLPLPQTQSFLTPHPCHILPSLSDSPDHYFPKEVSHECPARRPTRYTRPQACFTREKSDIGPEQQSFVRKGERGCLAYLQVQARFLVRYHQPITRLYLNSVFPFPSHQNCCQQREKAKTKTKTKTSRVFQFQFPFPFDFDVSYF